MPPRCKNPGKPSRRAPGSPRAGRCASPRPRMAHPRACPEPVCFCHFRTPEGTKRLSLTRKRVTSKHATCRKNSCPVPTAVECWAGLVLSGGTGASQVLPFSLLRCYVCMSCCVIVFCEGRRLATRGRLISIQLAHSILHKPLCALIVSARGVLAARRREVCRWPCVGGHVACASVWQCV